MHTEQRLSGDEEVSEQEIEPGPCVLRREL
jgi:hypothetical protein